MLGGSCSPCCLRCGLATRPSYITVTVSDSASTFEFDSYISAGTTIHVGAAHLAPPNQTFVLSLISDSGISWNYRFTAPLYTFLDPALRRLEVSVPKSAACGRSSSNSCQFIGNAPCALKLYDWYAGSIRAMRTNLKSDPITQQNLESNFFYGQCGNFDYMCTASPGFSSALMQCCTPEYKLKSDINFSPTFSTTSPPSLVNRLDYARRFTYAPGFVLPWKFERADKVSWPVFATASSVTGTKTFYMAYSISAVTAYFDDGSFTELLTEPGTSDENLTTTSGNAALLP